MHFQLSFPTPAFAGLNAGDADDDAQQDESAGEREDGDEESDQPRSRSRKRAERDQAPLPEARGKLPLQEQLQALAAGIGPDTSERDLRRFVVKYKLCEPDEIKNTPKEQLLEFIQKHMGSTPPRRRPAKARCHVLA